METIVNGCAVRTLQPVRFGNAEFPDITLPVNAIGRVRKIYPPRSFWGRRLLVRWEIAGHKTEMWVFPHEVERVRNSLPVGSPELECVEKVL